jgi:hypothetical protein
MISQVSESGDTPVTKKFTMRVVIEERVFEGLGTSKKLAKQAVLRIRIHMFLGLLEPDPDPSEEVWIRIWLRIRIWILLSPSKKSKKNLDSYCFVTSF